MERPVRKRTRLGYYNYSQPGYYFITICTQDKKKILGSIVGHGILDVPQTVLDSNNSPSDGNRSGMVPPVRPGGRTLHDIPLVSGADCLTTCLQTVHFRQSLHRKVNPRCTRSSSHRHACKDKISVKFLHCYLVKSMTIVVTPRAAIVCWHP